MPPDPGAAVRLDAEARGAFDREWTLAELLERAPRDGLARGLDLLLDGGWAIDEGAGAAPLLASAAALAPGAPAHPIVSEGEPIGRLRGAPAERLPGACALLQAVLTSARRYRMAVDVHQAAVAADYAELQRQHAELERSEARYRELATQLERRVAEQVATIETAQRQLFQAERMASVGQLAAGMAHEINNPIGFIQSNLGTGRDYLRDLARVIAAWRAGDAARAQALAREVDLDFVLEDFGGLLDESIGGAARIARIVADLKVFSAVDSLGLSEVDPNECLRATAAVAQPQAGARVRLELRLGAVARWRGDAGLLNQVLLSLVQNAIAAVADGGSVVLASRQDGALLHLQVQDDGCGIDAATLARIFDPFFTTRAVGQGTGLGLTVSRDIVRAMGGHIDVQSTPGAGSTFSVVLPLQSAGGDIR